MLKLLAEWVTEPQTFIWFHNITPTDYLLIANVGKKPF